MHPDTDRPSAPSALQFYSSPLIDTLMHEAGPSLALCWAFFNYLRPGIVTLGALACPLMFVAEPSYAPGLMAVLLAFLRYDVVLAHRQWREVFVDQLEGGVAIRDNEQGAPGLSDEQFGGPRNIVMRELPFWQWLRYKYTLRQDYILNSSWRWVRHHLRGFCLDQGLSFARRWHPKYQSFWGDPARELAELCLETSLCLGAASIDDDENGHRVATFRYDDWLCPAGTEVPGEVLEVSSLEVRVDLKTRTALACRLNGEPIGVAGDALCFLYLALSTYHHTAVHAYANWAAMPNHADAHVRRGAVWTLATNAVALYTGRVFQHDPRSMERVLNYNVKRGIPRHGSGALLREIAGYSRYTRFVYRARARFVDTIAAHGLEIDVESMFLSTVVHSLDHAMVSECVDPYDLVPSRSKHRAAQIVRLIFSEPLEPILVNTRLSAVKDGWPKALFESLSGIDADLAKRVDIGIAY